jgi:hypothetical protein
MAKSHGIQKGGAKLCPPNKFSFLAGCMSWGTTLAILALIALLIVCLAIMLSPRPLPRGVKKGDLIEERSNNCRRNETDYDADTSSFNYPKSIQRVGEDFEPDDSERMPNEGTGTPVSQRIKYDINLNIRDRDAYLQNPNIISYGDYQAAKNIERIVNPILPPERSYENTYGIPINIPSRGPNLSYQQIGHLYKEEIENPDKQIGNNSDTAILPLFARPTFSGSNRWNYYTSSDKFQSVKLPLNIDGKKCTDDLGCKELMNGDIVTIPSYNGRFKVEIYSYDAPRYIPFVY